MTSSTEMWTSPALSGMTNDRIGGTNLINLNLDLDFNAYRYRKDRPAWQQWRGIPGQFGIAAYPLATTKRKPNPFPSASTN